MSTSVLNHTGTLPHRARASKTAHRPPLLPFSGLFSLFRQSLSMMQAIPDNGRINPSQLAKVRAMAESL